MKAFLRSLSKFKAGDWVRMKHTQRVGRVLHIYAHKDRENSIRVQWYGDDRKYLYSEKELEFAETPIQRMKRLYNEN